MLLPPAGRDEYAALPRRGGENPVKARARRRGGGSGRKEGGGGEEGGEGKRTVH